MAWYVAPLSLVACLHLLLYSPDTWAEAGGLTRSLVGVVLSGTHLSAYLGCLALACLTAERPREPVLYR